MMLENSIQPSPKCPRAMRASVDFFLRSAQADRDILTDPVGSTSKWRRLMPWSQINKPRGTAVVNLRVSIRTVHSVETLSHYLPRHKSVRATITPQQRDITVKTLIKQISSIPQSILNQFHSINIQSKIPFFETSSQRGAHRPIFCLPNTSLPPAFARNDAFMEKSPKHLG